MRIKVNENFEKLNKNYLFSEISARVSEFRAKNPETEVISLGIGDVTRPLARCVAREMELAARGMSESEHFHGYGDVRGLLSLRESVAKRYLRRGVSLDTNEIFINDGAKSDLGNLCDILGENVALICDPVYPVYVDSSIISGREIRFLRADEENGFLPSPKNLPSQAFVIYLCSPNNPTGATFTCEMLKLWVDFALKSGSLIIFDSAYESYICDEGLPHSIFEIEGAKGCAIEVCSLSKTAGFTGVRCGWTIVPKDLCAKAAGGAKSVSLNSLWARRQATKFNGASYISQRGAIAALSPLGELENGENIEYYMENARILREFLLARGFFVVGGEHAPYLWFKCPTREGGSWQFFDYLLENAGVVGTPGVGFGSAGEGYFRFSSFASRENILTAIERLKSLNIRG